jgi:hypothetical protein
MPLFNTDLSFYGGLPGFGSQPGVFQPWQLGGGGQQSPYLGFSSFVPQQSAIPATAAGFLRSQIPELGDLNNLSGLISPDLRTAFQEFRGSEQALQPGGASQFAQGLLGREDVQGLLRRSELGGEGALIQAGGGAQSLQELVSGQLGQEGSALQNLFGTAFGAEAVTQDIRSLITGGESALAGELGDLELGGRGAVTTADRQALAAQLLGNVGGPIDIGGGQAFNPFSTDVLSDELSFGLGRSRADPTSQLRLATGLLSTQNLDITGGIAQTFSDAINRGADLGFGSTYGARATQGIAALAPTLQGLGQGASVRQSSSLGQIIDQLYAGNLQRGLTGGLAQNLQSAAYSENPRLPL